MRFSPVWGINLIPYTVCKSRLCRRILSRLRADLRENPTKQWASHDTLIQSAGSISNSARYHSDANIALGPILKMYIPGQIRISNALNSDGYSTGNAPPSGNNGLLADGTNPLLEQILFTSQWGSLITWLHGGWQITRKCWYSVPKFNINSIFPDMGILMIKKNGLMTILYLSWIPQYQYVNIFILKLILITTKLWKAWCADSPVSIQNKINKYRELMKYHFKDFSKTPTRYTK